MSADIMRSEILEQPSVCARLLDREEAGLRKLVASLKARKPKGIVLAARGSSDHAAIYARYLLEMLTGLPVSLAAPSLVTIYKAKPVFKDYLVVGVSQSGQGPDINAIVAEASRQGAITLGVTNDNKSGLAKAAKHLLYLGAEKERAVAATKTFTTELAGLALLAAIWSGNKKLLAELHEIPNAMSRVLMDVEPRVATAAHKLKALNACVVVGRGFQMGVAHEMGLKMKECAGVPALSYSTADFKHGPISLAAAGFPIFYVSAPGKLEAEAKEYTLDFVKRGAKVFRVGLRDPGMKSLPKHKNLDVSMCADAHVSEIFSPLLTILPGQWFAYHNALAKGLNPAMPKGLTKVTKTK